MRQTFYATVTAISLTFVASGALATDIVNEDDQAHKVTVVTSDGPSVLEVAAKSDLLDVCQGCEVSMEDGQVLEAEAEDTVAIVDGELSILK